MDDMDNKVADTSEHADMQTATDAGPDNALVQNATIPRSSSSTQDIVDSPSVAPIKPMT